MSDWKNEFRVVIPLKDAQMAADIEADLEVIYACFEANSAEKPACPLLQQYVRQMRTDYTAEEEILLAADVETTRAGGHELILWSGEFGECPRGVAGQLLQVLLTKHIPDGCAGFLWSEESAGAVRCGWIIATRESYLYRNAADVAAEEMRTLSRLTNKGILNELNEDE